MEIQILNKDMIVAVVIAISNSKLTSKKCQDFNGIQTAEAMCANPVEILKFFQVNLQLLKLQLPLQRSYLHLKHFSIITQAPVVQRLVGAINRNKGNQFRYPLDSNLFPVDARLTKAG